MKTTILAILASAAFAGAAFAAGSPCGNEPQSKWMTKDAMQQKAEGMGYKVRQVKAEKGCYEVYAVDPKGKRVEQLFNPVTGEAAGEDNDG
jgi:hypothetical protein